MEFKTFDLGNALAQAEQIKGYRLNNALAQQQQDPNSLQNQALRQRVDLGNQQLTQGQQEIQAGEYKAADTKKEQDLYFAHDQFLRLKDNPQEKDAISKMFQERGLPPLQPGSSNPEEIRANAEKGIGVVRQQLQMLQQRRQPLGTPNQNIAETNWFLSQSPEVRKQHLTVKRADKYLDRGPEFIVPNQADPSQTTVVAKKDLAPDKTLPYKADVKTAEDTASADVKYKIDQKKNERVYDTYKAAIAGLSEGLSGTTTGYVPGAIPAVTTGQQIAEGAVAATAPVLKDLFRSAGEGVFTDKDQELLLKMVPTRKDNEKARQAKIDNIDKIVRAKLGIREGGAQPQSAKQSFKVGGVVTAPNGKKVLIRSLKQDGTPDEVELLK